MCSYILTGSLWIERTPTKSRVKSRPGQTIVWMCGKWYYNTRMNENIKQFKTRIECFLFARNNKTTTTTAKVMMILVQYHAIYISIISYIEPYSIEYWVYLSRQMHLKWTWIRCCLKEKTLWHSLYGSVCLYIVNTDGRAH